MSILIFRLRVGMIVNGRPERLEHPGHTHSQILSRGAR